MSAAARPRLLGVEVDPVTETELVELISRAAEGRRLTVVGNLNLHGAALAHRDPLMRRFYKEADVVFVDGMALIAHARLLGHNLTRAHRTTYVDFVTPLMRAVTDRGLRVTHLGSTQQVVDAGLARLRHAHPALRIEGIPGYFDPTPGHPDNERVLDRVAASAPDLLFVGMGMPRQERWVLQNRGRLPPAVVITVGGALDYVAGVQPTPPRWMARIGLEGIGRLIAQPRRLGHRYLVEPWTLVPLALSEVVGHLRDRSSVA